MDAASPSPALAESRAPLPWDRWDEVEASLLMESSLPQNRGEPTTKTLMQAIDFCMMRRDFARVEWLNERLLKSSDPRLQALGEFNRGRLFARLDDFDRTEESWQKAQRLDPNNRLIQRQMGLLYAQFGFFAKSYAHLKAFEDEPIIAITLVAMERQMGLNEQADHRCEGLLKESLPAPEAWFNCSLLEFQNHRNTTKAIPWMDEAQRRAPPQSKLALDAQKQLSIMQEWKARFQADR